MEYMWEVDIYLYGGFEGRFIANNEKSTRLKRALAFRTPSYGKNIMNIKYLVLTFDIDDQLNLKNARVQAFD